MAYRVGFGHDLHRLTAGRGAGGSGGGGEGGGRGAGGEKLMLGGVLVSTEMGVEAHSDGDVVLHALVDALLGTVAAGDIGDAFPNSDPRWKGAQSRVFVEHALGQVTSRGWRVGNVDVLILAERPRLAAFKKPIAASVAALLSIAPDAVNVKAGTNEGCDAVGRGEAIAATVVVLVETA